MTRAASERVKGKWRITEVEGSEPPDRDLSEKAHIEFLGDGVGGFCMVGLDGDIDYIAREDDHELLIEFTWLGLLRNEEELCGRGLALTDGKNHMTGVLWIHRGERLTFRAMRWGRWLYEERTTKHKPENSGL